MMTIDEMLAKVADITGTAPKSAPSEKEKKTAAAREGVKPEVKTVPDVKEGILSNGLSMQPTLNLKLAKGIACCINRAAEMMNLSVVVAVTDAGGKLILLEAMDNSYIASVRAAQDKAYTAVALKMPTHEALKESRGGALDGYTNGDGILMLGGGYPLKFNESICGGIGVSGGTKDEDIALAEIGVRFFNAGITANIE